MASFEKDYTGLHSQQNIKKKKHKIIFQCSFHLVNSILPPLTRGMYSVPIEVFLPPLPPLTYDILQWLVDGVMVFQDFFLKDQAFDILMVQGENCRVDVAHCLFKICDGLCCAQSCMKYGIVMEQQHFKHLSHGMNLAEAVIETS